MNKEGLFKQIVRACYLSFQLPARKNALEVEEKIAWLYAENFGMPMDADNNLLTPDTPSTWSAAKIWQSCKHNLTTE
jgi:hypothetical protein